MAQPDRAQTDRGRTATVGFRIVAARPAVGQIPAAEQSSESKDGGIWLATANPWGDGAGIDQVSCAGNLDLDLLMRSTAVGDHHYHATLEYPYPVGRFHGAPITASR